MFKNESCSCLEGSFELFQGVEWPGRACKLCREATHAWTQPPAKIGPTERRPWSGSSQDFGQVAAEARKKKGLRDDSGRAFSLVLYPMEARNAL